MKNPNESRDVLELQTFVNWSYNDATYNENGSTVVLTLQTENLYVLPFIHRSNVCCQKWLSIVCVMAVMNKDTHLMETCITKDYDTLKS